jgi:hypothetical protein
MRCCANSIMFAFPSKPLTSLPRQAISEASQPLPQAGSSSLLPFPSLYDAPSRKSASCRAPRRRRCRTKEARHTSRAVRWPSAQSGEFSRQRQDRSSLFAKP